MARSIRGLRGAADSPAQLSILNSFGCQAALPLIAEGDRMMAAGDARGAAQAYVVAASSGCRAPVLYAALDDAVQARKPTWLWFGIGVAGALGLGFVLGRRSKRGR